MARLQVVDFLRGFAVVLMIGYHCLFTIEYFGFFKDSGFDILNQFSFLPYIIGSVFVIISGFVGNLCSDERQKRKTLELAAVAALISITTYFFDNIMFIKFGVIHLLTFCSALSITLKRWNSWLLIVIAIASLYLGVMFSTLRVSSEYLFAFGLVNNSYQAFDQYPIFPWLGIFIFGIIISREFDGAVINLEQKYAKLRENAFVKTIELLGRKSIQIYLIHEPIILGLLFIISRIFG